MKTNLILKFTSKSSLIPRLLAVTCSMQLHLHGWSTFSYNVTSVPENYTLRLMWSPCNDETIDESKESETQGKHYWVTGKGKATISQCLRRQHLPDPTMGTKNPMARLPFKALLCGDDDDHFQQLLLCEEPENSKLILLSVHVWWDDRLTAEAWMALNIIFEQHKS